MIQTMSLEDQNYDVTEGECPHCEDGALWVNSFELVCEHCDTVFRKNERQRVDVPDPIEEYRSNRDDHTYENTGTVIMPGGFFDRQNDIEPDNGIYGMGNDETAINNTSRRA